MRRLSKAGFKADFLHQAILPDWWEDSYRDDPSILPDVEIRVSRFLEIPLSRIRDPSVSLNPPVYVNAKLRRVKEIDRDRLAPAIHAALKIGGAVVRSLQSTVQHPDPPPANALQWRDTIRRAGNSVALADILGDLWQRGIPVVPVDLMPSPSFQGLASIVDGRPIVLLGHKHDEPGRVAFFIAHEVGHIVAGDCALNEPVVDEDEEILDESAIEQRADQYATTIMVGAESIPDVQASNWRDLAESAANIELASGVDASAVIFAWARRTGDYGKARLAVEAIYCAHGARRALREHLLRNLDLDNATESDRNLIRCVIGEPERDAIAS